MCKLYHIAVALSAISASWTVAFAGVPLPLFKDGDVVVFLGDSITHGGRYHEFIADYYRTRFPDRDIRFVNSGLGGDWAAGGLQRLDEDVAWYSPTCVAVHFGMNDINRSIYSWTPSGEDLVAAESAQTGFRKSYGELIQGLRTKVPAAMRVHLTQTPYDDTVTLPPFAPKMSGWGAVNQRGCNTGLALMAGFVQLKAIEDGMPSVNWYSPLQRYLFKRREVDPYYMLNDWDRVHPKALAHSIMAWTFLLAQGAPAVVSDVAVDAVNCAIAKADNATVSNVRRSEGALSFDVTARALPYPVESSALEAVAEFDVESRLNRERLAVAGLATGTYVLRIDGHDVGTYTADELSSGVSLGFNDRTPQYRQARKVFERTADLSSRERSVRDCSVVRMVFKGRKAPVDDVKAFASWFEKNAKDKSGYFESMVPRYLECWPKRDEIRKRMLEEQSEIRKLAKPVTHRYEVLACAGH